MTLRIKIGMLVAMVALSLAVGISAEPISQLQPSGYVNDFAHALDAKSTAQTNSLCQQIDSKAHAQIAVVTIRSLDGVDIESYAVALFKQWGVGSKSTNRGILILYAIQDRRARIEVGYGLEPILPDGKVGGIQREAIPQMRVGDYSGALLLVTSRVADVIAKDAGVQLENSVPRAPARREAQPRPGISLGGIIFIAIILLVVLATPLRGVLFWILLSMLSDNRGGSNWGGGGFGGGGGGGGFGGFGGGSSGGGGASSSW